MTFDHMDDDMYKYMKSLINLRHSYDEFKLYDNEWIDHEKLLIFKKGKLTIIINNTDAVVDYKLDKTSKVIFSNELDKNHGKLEPCEFRVIINE